MDNVDNVEHKKKMLKIFEENCCNMWKYKDFTLCIFFSTRESYQKISTVDTNKKMLITLWIMWITYLPSKDSPTFTISPAPIVINKSPVTQFFNKKFSISSKLGK